MTAKPWMWEPESGKGLAMGRELNLGELVLDCAEP